MSLLYDLYHLYAMQVEHTINPSIKKGSRMSFTLAEDKTASGNTKAKGGGKRMSFNLRQDKKAKGSRMSFTLSGSGKGREIWASVKPFVHAGLRLDNLVHILSSRRGPSSWLLRPVLSAPA